MRFSKQFPATTRRTFLKGAGLVSAAAVTGGFPIPAIAQAQEVTMISAENNGAALDALKAIAAGFTKETGVNVVINNMDHEAHKTAIRNYLVAGAPDRGAEVRAGRMSAEIQGT